MKAWKKVSGTNISGFFLPMSTGKEEEGTTPGCQTTSTLGDEGMVL